MAKIPLGNFGFRTPQGQDVTPTAQPDMQVGDALARVGGQAMAIGGNMLAEQRQEDERLARQAENVKVMTAHATIQNGLNDAYRAIDADVLDGKTDKLAGFSAWREASTKVVQEGLKGLPPDRAALVSTQLDGLQGRLEGQLQGTFRKRDQQDVAGGLVTMREQLERLATTDPAGAVKQYGAALDVSGSAAGWTPEQISQRKATFVEGVTFNQFRGAAQQAMQSGSIDALDAVQQRLAGKEGDALDPARRNQLDQTIFGWKQSIEAKTARTADKAEREETKRYNTARDTVNKAGDLVDSGAVVEPAFIEKAVAEAQGFPDLMDRLKVLSASQATSARFASSSATQRAATLEQMRTQRTTPGRGFDPEDQKQFDMREKMDAKLRSQVDGGEAWSAAQSVGIVERAPAINIANPAEALKVFQQRMGEIGDVEAWAGKKVSPLQPPEAEQLTKMLRALPPDQAASLLGQTGALLGDADRVAALGKQIGDKDGTLGTAMAYAGAKTTEGRNTAELLLRGDQMIRDGVVKPDAMKETGWKATIAQRVRGAYSNQEVETRIIDAAFKIAAAAEGDVERAIRLATGGIVERNGGKVPLPYGMKEADFDKRIAAITPDVLAPQTPGGVVVVGPTRVPVADFVRDLPASRLVHAGQGLYNVRAGNQLVTNERGQRITLKVSP